MNEGMSHDDNVTFTLEQDWYDRIVMSARQQGGLHGKVYALIISNIIIYTDITRVDREVCDRYTKTKLH
jgi:hypothetical protein